MLSETIKTLRKQAGMSQEQLAGRLNVSRQAVTKWETAAGTPDVENLRAISALLQISLDDLLENRSPIPPEQEFRFHSVTEYDIDSIKDFDITFSGANGVVMTGYEGEKLQVLLGSDRIANLDSAFKVKIDDIKKRIDVDVRRFAGMTESNAKESLHILIRLRRAVRPQRSRPPPGWACGPFRIIDSIPLLFLLPCLGVVFHFHVYHATINMTSMCHYYKGMAENWEENFQKAENACIVYFSALKLDIISQLFSRSAHLLR